MNKEETGTTLRKYDLEERTAKFGEHVVKFAKKILVNKVTERLIPQFVAAGTSIGANYCEADDAESSKDFVHKIGICKKETREVKHFLRMLAVSFGDEDLKNEARVLWDEARQLHLIFNAIYHKVKNKNS
ncbi:MAG: four helix bundle protein [Candidatus Magasanikbacteria bacterium]